MTDFENTLKKFVEDFDQKSVRYFADAAKSAFSYPALEESKKYSFFSGGKRFRPFLSYLTAQSMQHLKISFDDVFPIALATEMIHTYSLIHDDLPCMDNDDFRRGQPTNHKKFGQDVALLAGDAFLSDAFAALTLLKPTKSEIVIQIIQQFSEAIGSLGMVSGQTQDMKVANDISLDTLTQIHYLKTGRLIENSMTAVALFAQVSGPELQVFKSYGKNLGLAFQIKDDLLDVNDKDQDSKSFPFILGVEKTKLELQRAHDNAAQSLTQLSGFNTQPLKWLLDYNFNRLK